MRTLSTILLAATLLSPAIAEEEVIPPYTFQQVWENWKDLEGGRIVVTGGYVAQVGTEPNRAVYTDGTSAVLYIDTSQAINPDIVKDLQGKCHDFRTVEIAECRLDMAVTVARDGNFPLLTQPNFVVPTP